MRLCLPIMKGVYWQLTRPAFSFRVYRQMRSPGSISPSSFHLNRAWHCSQPASPPSICLRERPITSNAK
jgi:hypothetical protein